MAKKQTEIKTKPTNKKTVLKYIDDVLSGKVVACENIKHACERFRDFSKRPEYVVDWKILDRFVAFCGLLKHTTGVWYGQPLTLEPWQMFVVASTLCVLHRDTKLRVCRFLYLQIARKNGKTALTAALGLYLMIADGERDASIVVLANSLDQSKLNLKAVSDFAKWLDPKKKHLKIRHKDVKSKQGQLFIRAGDHRTLDGLNPSSCIIDEYHQGEKSTLEVMESGMGSRKQPLVIIITTPGVDPSKYCYSLRCRFIQILRGEIVDDSINPIIYELDDEDWRNPKGYIDREKYPNPVNFIKANPNLGVSVFAEYIHAQIEKSKNEVERTYGVIVKNLGCWVDTAQESAEDYCNDAEVRAVMREVDWEEFRGCTCYAGIDLASVNDINAVSFMIEKDGKYVFKTEYYLPEVTNNSPIVDDSVRTWSAMGYINVTPGNVMEYHRVLDRFRELRDEYGVSFYHIAVDKYNAAQLQVDLYAEGFPTQAFAQTIFNFNEPTKLLKMCIAKGVVEIDLNPVTRWCFANCVLKFSNNENCKCFKRNNNQSKKIDGVIAMQMALGGYLSEKTR